MTRTSKVSIIQNLWNDAQVVDKDDMDIEQAHNRQVAASIEDNHFGSGVLPSSLVQAVLFDSDILPDDQAALISSDDFDGTGLPAHAQPSDASLGVQLEIELTDTLNAWGRFSSKVLIIGLDFEGNPQYERFTFFKNEKQVSKKHYTNILCVFFNDFKGNNYCSKNNGGRFVIREASGYQLSRDPIMASQDVEPNLFFRDFKISRVSLSGATATTLEQALQAGIGSSYSVDSLDINTTVKQNRYLNASDISSKIGQKFKATTNNIQKITLLLGATKDSGAAIEDWYNWSGDLVISVHELQTTISCPSALVPELAIDYDPNPQPIIQLSFSQSELKGAGYVLSDVLQPVDFVFSDTQLGSASNPVIVPNRYYIVTINRSGSAGTGNLFTGVGNDNVEDSRLSLYGSSVWVDVPEEDLWFQVWTDAAKVADGLAYDAGNGIQVEKTEVNSDGATVDYCFDGNVFVDAGEGTVNTAIVQAVAVEMQEEQDERTGNAVYSRQQFQPGFSFVTTASLNELKATSVPIVIGAAKDVNPKSNPILTKTQALPGMANGGVFTVVAPDADLLSLNLIGSKLTPNTLTSNGYIIYKTIVCTDGYGDVNGDGQIDAVDIARATVLASFSDGLASSVTQQRIVDGYVSALEIIRADVNGDGYVGSDDVQAITDYVSRASNSFSVGSTFTRLDMYVQPATGRFDGYYYCNSFVRPDGYSYVLPSSLTSYEREYYGMVNSPDIEGTDSAFTTVPFSSVSYRVDPVPFWQDYGMIFSSDARVVMSAFTNSENADITSCDEFTSSCRDTRDVDLVADTGRNDIMIPDNLVMRAGQIINPDGTHYKTDLEVNHIVLEIPAEEFSNAIIDVFNKLVKEDNLGKTSAGYPAMKFSDCTYVQSDALVRNQIKFGVEIQAYYPNLDGYDADGYGVIVDNILGVYMEGASGLLMLWLKDLAEDPLYKTLVTKIQISVYLKKAGWNNWPLVIPPDQILGLLS